MSKTLEDAFTGLLQYWKIRPTGGTRAELLTLAVSQGFEEPLLAQWLDVFLAGFAATDRIPTPPDYNTGLAPLVASLGLAKATIAATEVFEFLKRDGRALAVIRRLNAAEALADEIAAHNQTATRLTSGRDWIIANAPNTPPPFAAAKQAVVDALAADILREQRLAADKTLRRNELLGA